MQAVAPGASDQAAGKGPEAFRTISEASTELGVPQHVLRFWETRFSFIRPMKRAGGRRFYRRQDLAVLKGVRTLLHEQGYTIKGVQRLHREEGVRRLIGAGEGSSIATEAPSDKPALAPEPRLAAVVLSPAVVAQAPEPPAAPQARPAVPILQPDARSRLEAVLRDIEGVKAGIDRLLTESD